MPDLMVCTVLSFEKQLLGVVAMGPWRPGRSTMFDVSLALARLPSHRDPEAERGHVP